MKRYFVLLLIIGLCSVAPVFGQKPVTPPDPRGTLVEVETYRLGPAPAADPWQKLEHKMAWVLVGALDGDHYSSAKAYEVIGKSEPVGGVLLPVTGDKLRLIELSATSLFILGFSQTGETRRLESPTTVGRRLDKDDYTGLKLFLGSVVQVHKVEIGRSLVGFRQVWALVSPPDQK